MVRQKIVRPVGYQVEYSYAGFEYRLTKGGRCWSAEPLPDQHPAAGKDKHRYAAILEYLREYNEA